MAAESDRPVATRVRRRGRTGGGGGFTSRIDHWIGPLHRETAWLGMGLRAERPNFLTHVLPRCLPTPTEEADGTGNGVITGRGVPRGRRPE